LLKDFAIPDLLDNRFEVRIAVCIKITGVWVVASYNFVDLSLLSTLKA
jgi:hypothetical protein